MRTPERVILAMFLFVAWLTFSALSVPRVQAVSTLISAVVLLARWAVTISNPAAFARLAKATGARDRLHISGESAGHAGMGR